jgi:peptidyl-prolyl cis-trans isomerase C
MLGFKRFFVVGFLFFCLQSLTLADDVVLADEGVSISSSELSYIVSRWTDQMQKSAANDVGDRLELLNVALYNKKIAREADKLSPDNDPEAYWRYVALINGAKRRYIIDEFSKNLEVPDLSALALERYETEKEKYARVYETRLSSHILFACPPGGQCSREDTKVEAQKVLDDLRAGTDFVEMVHAHSSDAGTKAKDGRFDKWMILGEAGVSPPYSGGVFEIDEIGGYSELVSTQFGVHIIRLDDIRPMHYKPYSEVKEQIVSDLDTEYRQLSIKEFLSTFHLSDEAFIDGAAMEKIFAPYGTAANQPDS